MAVSFVAFNSTSTFSVDASATLLVVAITRNSSVGAGATATWDGIELEVANNTNDWTQVFYLVDPPEGSGEVEVTPSSNVEKIYSGQYAGTGLDYVSSQEGDDNDSFSFGPTEASVMVYSMIAFTTSHTPLASNTERADADGSYYCDRLEASGGTFSVGITAGDEPAGVGALFEEADTGVSGTMSATAGAATFAGTGTVDVEGTMGATAGAATFAGSGDVLVEGTGTWTVGAATFSGSGDLLVEGSMAVTAGAATFAGTGEVLVEGTLAAAAGAATFSASGTVESFPIEGTLTATAGAATFSGSGQVEGAIIPNIPGTVEVEARLRATANPQVELRAAVTVAGVQRQTVVTTSTMRGTVTVSAALRETTNASAA